MNSCDIFLIHGIASEVKDNYYDNFVNGIRKYLPIEFDCNFHPIYWNELIQEREKYVYSLMSDMSLGTKSLRKFGCTLIGDVIAYAPTEKGDGFYYEVNKMIEKKIDGMTELHPKSKKVIISHSLGTQIGFSVCFQKPIDCLITMGSPILYFSLRFAGLGSFPKTLKKMYNFYNVNDPVSTIIGRNPALKDCEDIRVKSFNPRYLLPLQAHSMYFKSSFVHKKIAEILNGI